MTEVTAHVAAQINYQRRLAKRPKYINGDPASSELDLAPALVEIGALAAAGCPSSLEVEGFACVRHELDLAGVGEDPAAGDRYRTAMTSLMARLTGADEIIANATVAVRRQRPLAAGEQPSIVEYVHSDYTTHGLERVRGTFPAPSRPNVRRVALYNAWRLLSNGPTNRPLALCDARSVAAEDVIPGDSCFPQIDFSYEMAFIERNPAHRWIYFPQLTHKDVLVFKQADTDHGQPQHVPHTAFEDPSCPPGVEPRFSCECRFMAVWYA